MPGREALSEVRHFARIKRYADGYVEIMACDCPIFGTAGYEPVLDEVGARAQRAPEDARAQRAPDNLARAQRRARARVRDIAHANPELCWFVTFTLDAAVVDRYDVQAMTRRINRWLDNAVRRKGLCYVLVPERHADGALHYHGLVNDTLRLQDSGVYTGGAGTRRPQSAAEAALWEGGVGNMHKVYNVLDWRFGFSTAIGLYGERLAAVSYVCKYIGKQDEKIGGRWYYSGGGLRAPEVTYCDMGVRDVMALDGAYSCSIERAGMTLAIWRGVLEGDSGDEQRAAARERRSGSDIQGSCRSEP